MFDLGFFAVGLGCVLLYLVLCALVLVCCLVCVRFGWFVGFRFVSVGFGDFRVCFRG